MTETRRPARMRDIADAAGVSVSTVSRALQDAPSISVPVRAHVAAVAGRLGYEQRIRPALPARRPAPTSLIMMVGIEIFSGDAGSFYRAILDGIENEADRRGLPLRTALIGAGGLAGLPEGEDPAAGILLVGIDDPALIQAARRRSPAAILVNGQDRDMRLDGVAPANRRGAYLATRHLLDLGHRRIAHVTALRRQTICDRAEGYRAALTDAGIVPDPGLLIDLPQLQPGAAADAIRDRLVRGRLDATALFCGNDIVAAGCIATLAEAGLSVPGDVSVVGFDNTRATLRIRPGLTTVAIDTAEIAGRAVARLVERLGTPDLTPLDIAVGCVLVVRDSTAAPKESRR